MYILMHKDTPVMELNINELGLILETGKVFNEKEMPDGVCDRDSFAAWWKNNSIPTQRDSIRLGLECIGVSSTEELKLLSRGVSLTNHYWIKDEKENLKWADVNFWDNKFSPEIGEALFNHRPLRNEVFASPEANGNGALKKKWIEIDGEYYIEKSGTGLLNEEVFNEVFASQLMDIIKLPHAEYSLAPGGRSCYSKCITSNEKELIHFFEIIDVVPRVSYPPESEYEHFCKVLEHFDVKDYEKEMQKRLVVGYIIAETDMHYNNLALIKDENGTYLLSPFYDLGNSMYASVPTASIDADNDDIVARPFCNKNTFGTWKQQKELINEYPHLPVSSLQHCIEEYVYATLSNSEYKSERVEAIAFAIFKRAYNLQKYLMQKGVGILADSLITIDKVANFQSDLSKTISEFQQQEQTSNLEFQTFRS